MEFFKRYEMKSDTMDYKEKYEQWKSDKFFDEATRNELLSLDNEEEIEDRFYCDLKFGTGGLRGIMGAGTNRMNKYTVGKATMGLGRYLLDTYGPDICYERGIVIGYDTRNNSEYFAYTAGNILSGMGIRVYLHAHARPTPQLSFSVRFWNAVAGVVITASHNPKEYNGYKVYDEEGCQLTPWQAKKVTAHIEAITDYRTICFTGNRSIISMADVTDNFVMAVKKQSRYENLKAKANLKIIYTPLHGTGNVPVQKALRLDGFSNVDTVPEQIVPNGDFPTATSPNPEDRRALELAITRAVRTDADIVLGTDPDCDRVGIAVKTSVGYQLMTGNQIGALLTDYILSHTDLNLVRKPAVIKTVVSSELGAQIAKKAGVAVFTTLTGFKYIGEKICQFEQAQKDGDSQRDYTFIFGYEESYGYLAGIHVRDKDAVAASLLICEMAAEYKAAGKTLFDRMDELYKEFGYHLDAQDSFTLKGKEGMDKMVSMMVRLREVESLFGEDCKITDYSLGVVAEPGFGKLPCSNVLRYDMKDDSWIAVRPSGTEPKIKIYYDIKGNCQEEAKEKLKNFQKVFQMRIGLE